MKAKELLEVHACHDQLAGKIKGFNRVAAYRIQKNLALLMGLVDTQREAFRKTVELAKKERNGDGEIPKEEMDKIQADLWQVVQEEEVDTSGLRKIPADGIPWENIQNTDPALGICLNRYDLVEGEPAATDAVY